jgi:hypothetical protein
MGKNDTENTYPKVTDNEYAASFGIGEPDKEAKALREAAFKRACENRDFEIGNFWKRSLYFGGFIAIIFNGYVEVATGKSSGNIKPAYLDLYLILLGIIFSTAWILAIKGSKQWQENWEEHIDKLEDAITGPLYKTIYYNRTRLYSVSKICKVLVWIVFGVWIFLFLLYIYENCGVLKGFFCKLETIIFVILPILAVTGVILVMFLTSICQSEKGTIYKEHKKTTKGFIKRK